MRPFHKIDINEFAALIDNYTFRRRISEVHLHHTWRPTQKDYDADDGLPTIQGMWRYHVKERGFADIAQHITVAPDGAIWVCRDFNRPPASAKGFNGNSTSGPFMIEMIGDFDENRETPTDAQMDATIAVIALVQKRHGLAADQVRFHSEMSDKSCPGSSFDKAKLIALISSYGSKRSTAKKQSPFEEDKARLYNVLRSMEDGGLKEDKEPAELPHSFELDDGAEAGSSRSSRSSQDPNDLRDHWINLDYGDFSTTGRLRSSAGDVQRIFEERLPSAIAAAKARNEPLRLMIYAHGGLVPEDSAIEGMMSQVDFWRANNVYPLFFIWETGFWRSIKWLLFGSKGARGDFSDGILEFAARAAGGRGVWGSMITNAHRANTRNNGAFQVGNALRDLAGAYGDALSINLVGHSAGAIFQSYFIEDLMRGDGISIDELVLLAPAVRSDLFKSIVMPHIKKGDIKRATVFSLNDGRERARDPAMGPYGKSLLYLVHAALEVERDASILGMERCVRADNDLVNLFGLGSKASRHGIYFAGDNGVDDVDARNSGSATDAKTHGGLDDDVSTMNSALRRIVGKTAGETIIPLTQSRSVDRGVNFEDTDFLGAELSAELGLAKISAQPNSPSSTPIEPDDQSSAAQPVKLTAAPYFNAGLDSAQTGAKKALCVGIDDYHAINPLRGCLRDARDWAAMLTDRGWQTSIMQQEEATGRGLLQRLGDFLNAAKSGDDLIFQFSGHGAYFEDKSGDEVDFKDEAICCIDMEANEKGFLLDDQIRMLVGQAAEDVGITMFFDSCHSGSVSRAKFRQQNALTARGARQVDRRVREVTPSEASKKEYKEIAALFPPAGPKANMRHVSFGACQDNEFAYESNGRGDFTVNALQLLASGGATTNGSFADLVASRFPAGARQTPLLDCAPAKRLHRFALAGS